MKLIDENRLRELLIAEYKLNALETGGVDNWDWYGEALYSDEEDGYNLNDYEENYLENDLNSFNDAE